jgi:hypothetical protein
MQRVFPKFSLSLLAELCAALDTKFWTRSTTNMVFFDRIAWFGPRFPLSFAGPHKVLDDATLNTYRQWRFKPGACAPQVECPITFTTTGEID